MPSYEAIGLEGRAHAAAERQRRVSQRSQGSRAARESASSRSSSGSSSLKVEVICARSRSSRDIVERGPVLSPRADPSKLLVMFLSGVPDAAAQAALGQVAQGHGDARDARAGDLSLLSRRRRTIEAVGRGHREQAEYVGHGAQLEHAREAARDRARARGRRAGRGSRRCSASVGRAESMLSDVVQRRLRTISSRMRSTAPRASLLCNP